MKANVEKVLLEIDDMVVVGSARDFCLIVARLHKEATEFMVMNAIVRREGARWLLGGFSVGARVILSVRA